MSRTYTDKNGEKIKVSQEHLDVAVLLVDELQKTSPSRKCSWPKHKKMMEQEGFDDSDTTESYRQMIKFERKAKGSLPPIERVISRNVENKLEAIRDEIGNIQTAKLEARDDFNRLSKLKRDWSRELLVTEAIERAVSNIQVEKFERNYHAKEEVPEVIEVPEVTEVKEAVSGVAEVNGEYTFTHTALATGDKVRFVINSSGYDVYVLDTNYYAGASKEIEVV